MVQLSVVDNILGIIVSLLSLGLIVYGLWQKNAKQTSGNDRRKNHIGMKFAVLMILSTIGCLYPLFDTKQTSEKNFKIITVVSKLQGEAEPYQNSNSIKDTLAEKLCHDGLNDYLSVEQIKENVDTSTPEKIIQTAQAIAKKKNARYVIVGVPGVSFIICYIVPGHQSQNLFSNRYLVCSIPEADLRKLFTKQYLDTYLFYRLFLADGYMAKGDYRKARDEYLNLIANDRLKQLNHKLLTNCSDTINHHQNATLALRMNNENVFLENQVKQCHASTPPEQNSRAKFDTQAQNLDIDQKSQKKQPSTSLPPPALSFSTNQQHNAEQLRTAALVDMQRGSLDEAIEHLNSLVQRNPRDFNGWFNLGVCWGDKQNYHNSIICLEKSFHLNPKDPDVTYNLGVAFEKNKNFSQAFAYYDLTTRQDPYYFEAWFNLGSLALDLRKYQSARAFLTKCINLKPKNYEAWNSMGCTYNAMGYYVKAYKCFEVAKKINPMDSKLYYNEGIVQLHMRNYPQGIENFRQALDINPNQGEAVYHIALGYYWMNNYLLAEEYCKDAIKMVPLDGKVWGLWCRIKLLDFCCRK